jgi:hypothetical protein
MDCNIQGGCIKVNAGSSPLICRNEISESTMDGIDVCGVDVDLDAPADGARHSRIDSHLSSTSESVSCTAFMSFYTNQASICKSMQV